MSQPSLRSLFVVCKNMEGSIEFYRGLGFAVLRLGSRSTVLTCGEQIEIHLHEPLTEQEKATYGVEWSPGSGGLVLSFEVDNLDSLVGSLPEKYLLCKPRLTPWGSRLAMAKDPDGHRLEFRERT